eukprot:tig00000821_g4487.t1
MAEEEGARRGLFGRIKTLGTQIKQALRREPGSQAVFLTDSLAFARADADDAASLVDYVQQSSNRPRGSPAVSPCFFVVGAPLSGHPTRGSVVHVREDFVEAQDNASSFLNSALSFVRSVLNWSKADSANVACITYVAGETEHEALVGLPYALLAMCLVFLDANTTGRRALETVLARVATMPADRAAGPGRAALSPAPPDASPSAVNRAVPPVSASLRRYLDFFTEVFRSELQPVVEGSENGPLLTGPQAFLASIASRRLRLERIELRFSSPPYLDAILRHRIEGQRAQKFFCVHVHANRRLQPSFTSAPWDELRSCHCTSAAWPAPVQEARGAGDPSSGTVLRLGEDGDGVELEGDCVIDLCHACTATEAGPGYCHRLFRVALHPAFVLPCGAARLRRSHVDVPPGLQSVPLLHSALSPASSGAHAAEALAPPRSASGGAGGAGAGAGPSSPAPGCPFCAQFKASSFFVDLAAALFASRLDEAARGFCDVRWLDGGPADGPAPDDAPPAPLSPVVPSPSPTPPSVGASPAGVSRRLPFSLPFFNRDRDAGPSESAGRHRHRSRAAAAAAAAEAEGADQMAADEAFARQLQEEEDREARRALRRRVAQVRAAAEAAAAGQPNADASLANAASALLAPRGGLAGVSANLAARLAAITGRPRRRWIPAPMEGGEGGAGEGAPAGDDEDYPTFTQERLRDLALNARQLEQLLAHVGYDLERLNDRQLADITRRIDRLAHGQAGGYEDQIIRSLPTYVYQPPASSQAQAVPEGATEEEAAVAAAAAAADAAEQEAAGGSSSSSAAAAAAAAGGEEASARECSVCLSEWRAGERLKILPCIHTFHVKCIERWLQINLTCPSCNRRVDELPELPDVLP